MEICLISLYLISMWKEFVKDYLSFTKKDRHAAIVLITLIVIVVLLPYIWPAKKHAQLSEAEKEQIKLQVEQLKETDNAAKTIKHPYENPAPAGSYPAQRNDLHETFYFDPNTLDAQGWKRLGIRDKTIATIENYRAKGGKFRTAHDIGKIYGLFKDDYERLLPYVKIADQAEFEKRTGDEKKMYIVNPKKHFAGAAVVEINNADTTAFIALPGIGSKLAARIISFRDKLGGFYTIQQVAETYGLPDSSFAKIKPLLQCNDPAVRQLNINTADANTLKQHPYIRWSLANIIVQYRSQHGNFASLDDLLQITLVTPELLQKIRPYLTVQ